MSLASIPVLTHDGNQRTSPPLVDQHLVTLEDSIEKAPSAVTSRGGILRIAEDAQGDSQRAKSKCWATWTLNQHDTTLLRNVNVVRADTRRSLVVIEIT